MRPTLALLACFAVLYHLTVGCCEHAHGAEAAVCEQIHTHHHHAEESLADTPSHEPHDDHPHDDCHESHCHVVVPLKVAGPDAPAINVLLPPLAAERVRKPAISSLDEHRNTLPWRFSRHRCHLVLQHFLI